MCRCRGERSGATDKEDGMVMTPEQARQASFDFEDGKLTFEELKEMFTGFRFTNYEDLSLGMSIDDCWPAPRNPHHVFSFFFPRELRHELVRHARATVDPDAPENQRY